MMCRVTRYRYVTRPGHPLADSQGHLPEHRAVLYDKIGPGLHHCHWCGALLRWTNGAYTRKGSIVTDHIDGKARNNKPTNLVPSCQSCNLKRHKKNLVKDHEIYILRKSNPGRHRAVAKECRYCGSVMLVSISETRPNHGLFCSRSCARRGGTRKTHKKRR
jgi:hypothetical protein